MVAFLFYWFSLLVQVAWIVLSIGLCGMYLKNKENGNLWAFGALNILSILYSLVVIWIYNTWDFGVKTSGSFMIIVGILVVLTILEFILGREPKAKTA
ncbi:hypothetical protein ACWOFR_02765 [Carnobacterium gallinarum]|uniref:hypothetical protein n=1 Tax=Carnobacterium gallinarum TaxID=2749 RepID=UPI0005520B29|nr:hypothetical protein [Carnobacterium gallinarum]